MTRRPAPMRGPRCDPCAAAGCRPTGSRALAIGALAQLRVGVVEPTAVGLVGALAGYEHRGLRSKTPGAQVARCGVLPDVDPELALDELGDEPARPQKSRQFELIGVVSRDERGDRHLLRGGDLRVPRAGPALPGTKPDISPLALRLDPASDGLTSDAEQLADLGHRAPVGDQRHRHPAQLDLGFRRQGACVATHRPTASPPLPSRRSRSCARDYPRGRRLKRVRRRVCTAWLALRTRLGAGRSQVQILSPDSTKGPFARREIDVVDYCCRATDADVRCAHGPGGRAARAGHDPCRRAAATRRGVDEQSIGQALAVPPGRLRPCCRSPSPSSPPCSPRTATRHSEASSHGSRGSRAARECSCGPRRPRRGAHGRARARCWPGVA